MSIRWMVFSLVVTVTVAASAIAQAGKFWNPPAVIVNGNSTYRYITAFAKGIRQSDETNSYITCTTGTEGEAYNGGTWVILQRSSCIVRDESGTTHYCSGRFGALPAVGPDTQVNMTIDKASGQCRSLTVSNSTMFMEPIE